MTLSPVALNDRATAAVQQSIEIVRRRIDETGVVDPIITRAGRRTASWCSCPAIEDPNRIKELLGKTAQMTFRLVDENANPGRRRRRRAWISCRCRTSRAQKIAVRRRVEVDGADLTDARRRGRTRRPASGW